MFHVTNVTKIIEIDEPLMNHMQKRMLERSTLLFKLALVWFLSRVASHMLLQVTILMESFVTLGAFLRRLPKSGVFAPCVRNMGIFNLGLYLIFFGIGRTCKYFSCGKSEKIMETDENIMNHMR